MSILPKTSYAIAISALCLVAAGPAISQNTSDTTFAMKAAQGGMAEVKMGQLAEEKGSSQAVKDFGKHMVQDHSKANDQLKEVAAKDNISLPSDLNAKDKATYDKLSGLSGTAFDRAYTEDMVKDHQMVISEFKKEASSGKNDDVKNFASQTLPTLNEHLKMAEQMRQTSAGSAAAQGSGSSSAHDAE